MKLNDLRRTASMSMREWQRGVTLIELLLAIGIMGLVVAGAASLIDNHLERMRVAATAQQMTVFGNAVQAYIKDNYPNLLISNPSSGVPFAQASVPAVITTTILQTTPLPSGTNSATKYLPANFVDVNAYGQKLCALVLQPKVGELYALVITEGGNAINDVDLGLLAGSIGGAGGAIYTSVNMPLPNIPPATAVKDIARGTMGKWYFNLKTDPVGMYFSGKSTKNCSGAGNTINLLSGHPLMALWFSSDTSSAFLYRNAVPNHPELNTMGTDIKFNDDRSCTDATGKTITCFGASISLQIARTPETKCDDHPTGNGKPVQVGTLARDTSGSVLSCQLAADGITYWRSVSSLFWGDPVENWAALNSITCDATHNSWQTRVVKYPTVGSGPRAYTCGLTKSGGSTWAWQPLAVDDKGTLQLGTGYYTEGQKCDVPGIGAVTKDKTGQLLVCTSVTSSSGTALVWKGSAAIGRFKFTIQGYADPFVGTGHLNSAGQFSGTLSCDPNQAKYGHVYNPACGSGGTVSCAPPPNPQPLAATKIGVNISTQPACAYFFALHSQTGWGCLFGIPGLCLKDPWHYLDAPLMVDVVDLPVLNVVQQW